MTIHPQRRLFSGLRVYVGQTRSRALVAQLADAGIGECVTRGQLPPRRTPWFYDNGAFADFKAGREFNEFEYWRDLRKIRSWCEFGQPSRDRSRLGEVLTPPDFIVLPDLVAQGLASLEFSLAHLEETQQTGTPYLAVQDGMTPAGVRAILGRYPAIAGLFVGGSMAWKLETAGAWCQLGRRSGRPVHIGRVGTLDRLAWAESIGATSIDSSLPLWQRDRLNAFIEAVA